MDVSISHKITEKYFEIYHTGMEETCEPLESPITIRDWHMEGN
jgi:hypothetical protein